MIYDLEEDQYLHDDASTEAWHDDDPDDGWDDNDEPPDGYYDREETEPMGNYDDQFSKTERARVEALRLLAPGTNVLAAQLPEAERIATMILGPEHTVPDPYRQLREAATLAGQLVVKAGAEVDAWKGVADDADPVTVTKGDLRALWHLLESITNPF